MKLAEHIHGGAAADAEAGVAHANHKGVAIAQHRDSRAFVQPQIAQFGRFVRIAAKTDDAGALTAMGATQSRTVHLVIEMLGLMTLFLATGGAQFILERSDHSFPDAIF
jgi:hypothetical protein